MMKSPEAPAREGDGRVARRDPETVGQALVRRRVELGQTRDAAADAVGVSRSTYSAYESDQRRLSPDALRTLAAFLNADLEEILDLYGATCVVQARRALLGDSSASIGVARTGIRRTARSEDMAIVERVYFDGPARDGAGDASARTELRPSDPGVHRDVAEGDGAKKKREKGAKKSKAKAKKSKVHKKRHASKAKKRDAKKDAKKAKSKNKH